MLSLSELQKLVVNTTQDPTFAQEGITKEKLLAIVAELKKQLSTSSSSGPSFIQAVPGVELDTLDWSGIALGERIASGSFGEVFRGQVLGTPCATKVFKRQGASFKMKMAELRKEIDIMRRIRHPNIVALLGISTTPTKEVVILMELMQGTLNDYRTNNRDPSDFDRLRIARDIARGLSWLHTRSPPILHLDLKFDNVLYDANGIMKVTDFGLSAFLPEAYLISELRLPGNIGHMSPEIIKRLEFNTKADVFSYGIMLWEIMRWKEWEEEIIDHLRACKIPTRGDLGQIVKAAIVYKNFRPVMPEAWLPSLRETLELAWHADMTARPSMHQLLTEHLPRIDSELRANYLQLYLGHDQLAHELWREHFYLDIPNPIPVISFLTTFYSSMGYVWPADEQEDLDLSLFKLALDIYDADKPVTVERFAKVVAAFGPLRQADTSIFRAIEAALSNDWFHPEEEADKQDSFVGQPSGAYLVRFSRHAEFPFTLTRWHAETGLKHFRIARREDDTFHMSSTPARRFPSLRELIEDPATKAEYQLSEPKTSLPLSRAQQLRLRLNSRACPTGNLYDEDAVTTNSLAEQLNQFVP